MFEIKKKTKQGDSLSGLLFKTVLQNSLKEVTQRWQKKKGMGIYLSDHDHESVRYLGPVDHIPATGNDRNQESYQCSLGHVSQVQAGTDIEKLLAQTPSPTVRRSNNSDDMLRIWNMGTHQRARKNDTIDATQNAPSHHTNKKKIQKDRETQS